MSNFASFVGVTGREMAELSRSPGWQACIARSASRVAVQPVQVATPRTLAAYRGPGPGFHRDDSWMVLLDGTVENLRELAASPAADPHRSGDERRGRHRATVRAAR